MAKQISQATFDDVVKENIVDFSMSPDEARQETIKQFEAQGINLANIIQNLSLNPLTGKPLLNEACDELKTYISEKSNDTAKLLACLNVLDEECQKSIPHRVLAGKNGAHEALITLLEQELCSENKDTPNATNDASNDATPESKPNLQVLAGCLQALNSLSKTQPDIFDAEALAILMRLLLNIKDENVLALTLMWLQKVSVLHEMNRQNIVTGGILKCLKPFISKDTSKVLLCETLAALRYLVLDDDIRVDVSSAHEHARLIAGELLMDLCGLLKEFSDKNVLSDLLLTIATLAVRQEFCERIEDAGALKATVHIMSENPSALRLNREALKLLRALGGSDKVKNHVVEEGAAPLIQGLLENHKSNEALVGNALACVSTLTLRSKENSAVFFENGIAEHVAEVMNRYPKSKIVQRNSAWVIRNMVSRSRNQCESWLSYGVEDLLNAALAEHPSVGHDIRAALRDLGCPITLTEEWTGTAEKKIASSMA